MFAVIKTGGKQYRVAAQDMLKVDRLKGEPGEIVQFGEVLLVGGDDVTLGKPTITGASVAAEVLEQGRGPKIIAFKKRRRKNSRRKRGFRQEFTLVRITEILTDGAAPTMTASVRRRQSQAGARGGGGRRRRGRSGQAQGQAEGGEEAGQEAGVAENQKSQIQRRVMISTQIRARLPGHSG